MADPISIEFKIMAYTVAIIIVKSLNGGSEVSRCACNSLSLANFVNDLCISSSPVQPHVSTNVNNVNNINTRGLARDNNSYSNNNNNDNNSNNNNATDNIGISQSHRRRQRSSSFGGIGIHDRLFVRHDQGFEDIEKDKYRNQQNSGDNYQYEDNEYEGGERNNSATSSPAAATADLSSGMGSAKHGTAIAAASSHLLDAATNIAETFMQQHAHEIKVPDGES